MHAHLDLILVDCLDEIRLCCDVQETVFVPENIHQHRAKRRKAQTNDARLAEHEEYVSVKERGLNIEHGP